MDSNLNSETNFYEKYLEKNEYYSNIQEFDLLEEEDNNNKDDNNNNNNNLESSNDIIKEYIFRDQDEKGLLLHNLLSKEESDKIIKISEEKGFEECSQRKDYRNCMRIVVKNEKLSNQIWKRIKNLIKTIEITENKQEQIENGIHPCLNIDGSWEPIRVSELWRICKYFPGGHFAPHYDGNYVIDNNCRSFKTIMLYLNDNFQFGSTHFLHNDCLLYRDPQTLLFCSQPQHIHFSISPRTGSALIFNHMLAHEGQQVLSSPKYILRSEIIFQRSSLPPLLTSSQLLAQQLLVQAEFLEKEGQSMQAMQLYRRAFKLYPELELNYNN
eukprot:TRINITY_DN848_c0_g1_i1.p1 TRINITY_DN848_c0_g1~~TRINITY_DN848_c0_g1_i1.p1  ORF type:complete len:326 (+),score=140.48 TRINITY_DN848_c0_g1_i1:103-1080(+)